MGPDEPGHLPGVHTDMEGEVKNASCTRESLD